MIPARSTSSAGRAQIVADWGSHSARRLIGTAGRLTNPERFSHWVLQRLNQLPDVAEFTRG